MNLRKIFLILACILSGVSVFVPLYTLELNGESVQGASVMPSFYGIAIIATAILNIGFLVVGLKKGYLICSLINVGCCVYASINAAINKESASYIVNITSKLAQNLGVNTGLDYKIGEGPGFFMLIFSAILVLVLMFWNVAKNDD